ncbi:MAG: hypothetical protein QW594_00850 [Candidatus Woesearchaeota archaeon]
MADDDDYQIIPKHEIEELKKEIERIKRNPLEHTPQDLLSGIIALNQSINQLLDVFKEAAKLLKEEQQQQKQEPASKDLFAKIAVLEEQNKSIAAALVSFGEKASSMQQDFVTLQKTVAELHAKLTTGLVTPSPSAGVPLTQKSNDEIGSFWRTQEQKPASFPPSPSPPPLQQPQPFSQAPSGIPNPMMAPPAPNPFAQSQQPPSPFFQNQQKPMMPQLPPAMPPPPFPKKK